jgi:hypothetical protein
VKKEDWLKVLERYKVLTLVQERRITQRQAAQELSLSLFHTKRLLRKLKRASGNPRCLDYQRAHPAANRTAEEVRGQVVILKRQNRERSNALIVDPSAEGQGKSCTPLLYAVPMKSGERGEYTHCHLRRPCRRFEREAFGELVQMDTSSGAWLEGYRRVYLVLLMDDYSRAILSCPLL